MEANWCKHGKRSASYLVRTIRVVANDMEAVPARLLETVAGVHGVPSSKEQSSVKPLRDEASETDEPEPRARVVIYFWGPFRAHF